MQTVGYCKVVYQFVLQWSKNPSNTLQSLFLFVSLSWKEWVIDPSEEFYYGWLQVMIFPIIYNWVVIIFR